MTNNEHNNSIAVIGMAGRFPGAETIAAFWEALAGGRDLLTAFSDAELLEAGVAPEAIADPYYVKRRGTIDGYDQFAAAFFGYTPREAEITDPQQRVFLECAWEALEHAGYDPERFPGLIGVYAGASMNTYMLQIYANPALFRSIGSAQTKLGNSIDHLSTRVAYKLNLNGPCITVQAACATSLVAIHLACQSLLNGECDMALAGGVSISVPHTIGYWYEAGGIVAPDGHCRAFEAQAAGTVPGAGAGLVVLKRLSDALQDRDMIYAVVRGSAVNNDGSAKVGFTAPALDGQTRVIAEAQALADVSPRSIGYVEAHGTATRLGDPIEVQALTRAFRAQTSDVAFCALGSVKSNIGHLDAAAGVAGFIKATLALKHQAIPPSLHFETPNPACELPGSPFYIPTALTPWPDSQQPRRAAVSSFGIGGTNAHVVLEQAPEPLPSSPGQPPYLLTLSAKSPTALNQTAARLAATLEAQPALDLADVAFTLLGGRQRFAFRRVLLCHSREQAIEALGSGASSLQRERVSEARERPLVWLLPGQGSQYLQMGSQLYRDEPVFRQALDECATLLRPLLGRDLRTLLYPSDRRPTTDDRRPTAENADVGGQWSVVGGQELEQTQYAQPALFVVEYALGQLLLSWGVRPDALLGHSLGEYVAACLAEAISLEEALWLVATRGRLMQQMPAGAMLSVALASEALANELPPGLSIAAQNAPQQCVVSGPREQVLALQAQLSGRGVESRLLVTSHAFHSSLLEGMLSQWRQAVAQVQWRAPQIPILSNVHGGFVTTEQVRDVEYWVAQVRQPVQFAAGVATARAAGYELWLEVGPGRALSSLVRRQVGEEGAVVAAMRHPKEARADREVLLQALGELWLAGLDLAIRELFEAATLARLGAVIAQKQQQQLEQIAQLIDEIDTLDVTVVRAQLDAL